MEKETYYKAAVIILAIALAAVIIQNQMILSEIGKASKEENKSDIIKEEVVAEADVGKIEVSESEMLEKLKQFPEVKPYENYTAEITLLTEENLTELAEKQPAIYRGIQPGTYRIVFKSEGSGLLVIYDSNENKILLEFELRNVKL